MIKEAQWVKVHVMCGVSTNIITSCEATTTMSADSPYLAPFVKTTAQNFTVNEVSGDKAYLSRQNLREVQAVGGTAYIPFKTNSVAHSGHHKRDGLWERAFHFYNLNRAEFSARSKTPIRSHRPAEEPMLSAHLVARELILRSPDGADSKGGLAHYVRDGHATGGLRRYQSMISEPEAAHTPFRRIICPSASSR